MWWQTTSKKIYIICMVCEAFCDYYQPLQRPPAPATEFYSTSKKNAILATLTNKWLLNTLPGEERSTLLKRRSSHFYLKQNHSVLMFSRRQNSKSEPWVANSFFLYGETNIPSQRWKVSIPFAKVLLLFAKVLIPFAKVLLLFTKVLIPFEKVLIPFILAQRGVKRYGRGQLRYAPLRPTNFCFKLCCEIHIKK